MKPVPLSSVAPALAALLTPEEVAAIEIAARDFALALLQGWR